MHCLSLRYTRGCCANTQQFGLIEPANKKTFTRKEARCLSELSR